MRLAKVIIGSKVQFIMPDDSDGRFDLDGALVSTIKKTGLDQLSGDLAEVALDQFLEKGTLRDLPIVGTVIGVGRLGTAIRDYFFLRKVVRFLQPVSEVPIEERYKFARRITDDPDYRSRVGDNLALILERVNHFRKANMLGTIYAAHMKGEIDTNMLERLVSSVDALRVHDIEHLIKFYEKSTKDNQPSGALQGLAIAGLVGMSFGAGSVLNGGGGGYRRCELGEKFIEIVLS